VLQLQQQNAALQSKVARLKALLTQSCPSNAWAAVLASNASASGSCSSPGAEGCACPCHALAEQFAGALVRYKGLLAQLQQQVLHLQVSSSWLYATPAIVSLSGQSTQHRTWRTMQHTSTLTSVVSTTPPPPPQIPSGLQ